MVHINIMYLYNDNLSDTLLVKGEERFGRRNKAPKATQKFRKHIKKGEYRKNNKRSFTKYD